MIAQAAALIIFVGMFVLIILDKFERQWITLVSGLLMLIVVSASVCTARRQLLIR